MKANPQKVVTTERPAQVPPGREAKLCACGLWFSLPACHAKRHKSCSAECSAAQRMARAGERARPCAECGKRFIPRPNQLAAGGGRCCSNSCHLHAVRKTQKFKDAVRAAPRRGPKSGPENPQWMGGPAATTRRRIESGKANAYTRKYRAENPHRAREWAQNRRNRKSGRLEYGTIPRLLVVQRGLCAYCACDLEGGYHVDHIIPLSKGGRHEAVNIQLLCASCNLRKSNKDPIRFAEQNGKLL